MPKKKTSATPAAEEEQVTTNEEGVAEESTEETTEEEGTQEATPAAEEEQEVKASEALVYNRYHNLMQTYTLAEHGNGFIKLANELVNQPRRQGWFVVVR